jgi:1,4-dihydroxy-2-naphthoate octaprenyltransferase
VRVTQAGLLPPAAVRNTALACFLAALAAGVPLVIAGGIPILVLGVLSLLFGYVYTGGPYPLAYTGLGELFVLIFFGLGAVGGTFYLQAGGLAPEVALAGVQVGLLACGLLAVNNLRDVVEDARSDKRTLAVLLGPGFGRGEVAFCLFAPFALGLVWIRRHETAAALVPWLALPVAATATRIVLRNAPSAVYNRALALAAGTGVSFGALLALGLLL